MIGLRDAVICRSLACVALLLVALLGLAGAVLVGSSAPAAAAQPSAPVEITLTKVSPEVPSRDDTVTLTGRVKNVSDQPLVRLQVLFWRSQSPITDLDGLEDALYSAPNQPLGRRLFREPGAYQDLYTPDAPTLAPGASATFTVKADATALALPPTDGVYLMGVHVLQDGVNVAVGRSRVLVPVISRAPSTSVKVATLVAMTTRPSLLGPGLLSDSHLAAEIAPGGRLRNLVEAAQRKGVSYAVDPALVAEVETMRDGYLVRHPDGTTSPGSGQADAAWWLANLTQLRTAHDGYRLLFAAPDVAAAAHNRNTAALSAATAAGQRNLLTADLPLIVLPTGGAADPATLKAALALKPRAVLLSDLSTQGAGPVLDSGTSTPVLSYIAGGLGGGPGPDPQDDAIHTRQRALATSWVNLADPNGRAAQVHLVQTTGDAASTTADAPWSTSVPLADILRQTPARWGGVPAYPTSARQGELTRAQLAQTRRLSTATRTWADLLVDGEQARADADTATARSFSSSWRGQPTARNAYLQPQQASVDARLEHVQISTIPQATTTAQQGVSFPITIRNTLTPQAKGGDRDPMAIHVELRFASANNARLKVATLTADPVPPDGAYTANAKVTAKANGTVPVTAQLYTRHGYTIGRPATIEVHVTQNGTTGWAITVIAGVVLIGSTTWRIRQVSRDREETHESSAPLTPALTSVPSTALEADDDHSTVRS